MFRSEDVSKFHIFLPKENAIEKISNLFELNSV
jgi:hypothetical protein